LTNETRAWLEDLKANGGLSDEAFNSIRASVENNPKADEHIKGSVLRQSDYSRQSAEVQKAKKDAESALQAVADKEAALTKYQGELATWQGEASSSFTKAVADKEKANLKAAKALERIATLQTKYGIPDEDVKLDDVVLEAKKESVVEQAQRGLTEEDLRRIVGGGLAEAGYLDATIHDLSVQHQELFGTPLRDATKLVQEALAAKVPLTQYYAAKYKVEERQKVVAEEQYQQRLKNDVEAEVAKRVSNLPSGSVGLRADQQYGPVKTAAIAGKLNAIPTDEGTGISAALAAYNAGKYRGK